MSELTPNSRLTDTKFLGDDIQPVLKKELKNLYVNTKLGDQYLNTEYYLTREPYKNLKLYNGTNPVNWFEWLIMQSQIGTSFFAFTPVMQVNFYHHYLNNRVMFVTGSTGQGKSSVVPILFYYATIALTLNFKAKVLSTQALVSATQSNSEYMSSNLGVPIKIGDYKTTNGFVQYSTHSNKHIVKKSDTFIYEVIDRILLNDILQNPLLKKKKSVSKNEYLDENLYDIIIVDEAHMHNVSMDMILTLIRNTIMINNQIKLVITSATMDADEHRYRRFYKFVDENFMYPLMYKLLFSEFIDNYSIDKNCVDRRFHISPPGESDRFTVTDIYTDRDFKNYEECEIKGIEIVRELMSKMVGDLLFFTTTTNNTIKIAKELNKFLPSHIIALPLYSKIKEVKSTTSWFEVVRDIHKHINDIEYSKQDIVDIIVNGNEESYPKLGKGIYKIAIIVATNVVEASITIPTLKYVIDTGYANNVKYNYETGQAEPSIEKISNASSLQRRGRVGRVSDGTVYYTYTKASHENINPEYEMITKDITFDIMSIMATNPINKIDMNNHPQAFRFKLKNYDLYNDFLKSEPIKSIRRIYLKQYSYAFEGYEPKEPFGSVNFFPKLDDFNEHFGSLYIEGGYGFKSVLDHDGTFYLIHHGEDAFDRNIITGEIINSFKNNKYNKKYSDKIYKIFDKLQFLKYIYTDTDDLGEEESDEINSLVHKYSYINIINDIKITHTDTFEKINIKSEEDIIKIVKCCFISRMLDCNDDVLKILSLLYASQSYDRLILKGSSRRETEENKNNFVNKWKNNESELIAYLKIMNSFSEFFTTKKKDLDENKLLDRFEKFQQFFGENGYRIFVDDNLVKKSIFDKEEIKQFINAINKRSSKEEFMKMYNKFAKEVIIVNNDNLDKYCTTSFIEKEVIILAINIYDELKSFMNKSEQYFLDFEDMYLLNKSKFNPIVMTFLENFVHNISKVDNKKFQKLLVNSSLNDKMPFPSLVNFFDSYYFYCNDDKMGMTPITSEMIKLVINYTGTRLMTLNKDPVLSNPDLVKITSKAKIVKNNEISKVIKGELNIASKFI